MDEIDLYDWFIFAVWALSSARQVTNYRSEWTLCIYVVCSRWGVSMIWKCEFDDLYMRKSYSIGSTWRFWLWCWKTMCHAHAIEMLSILRIESVWAVNYTLVVATAIAIAWRFQREATFIKTPNEWPTFALLMCMNWRRRLYFFYRSPSFVFHCRFGVFWIHLM